MDFVSIDSSLIQLLIPIILLYILYLIIQSIKSTHISGILLIDYFKIRQLDIIFAFIFIYIMFVFLSVTIIFAYNQLYIKQKKCDPLMLYLGSKRACSRTDFENFENKDEPLTEKITFLGNILSDIIKTPFTKLYSIYLAILLTCIDSFRYIWLTINRGVSEYFIKQDEIYNKVRTIFIEPLLLKVTDPLFKTVYYFFDVIS